MVNGYRVKIVVMSATLEVDKFCGYFNTQAVVKVQGRAYPIEIYHSLHPQKDYIVNICI